jgi:hypothetical protein
MKGARPNAYDPSPLSVQNEGDDHGDLRLSVWRPTDFLSDVSTIDNNGDRSRGEICRLEVESLP